METFLKIFIPIVFTVLFYWVFIRKSNKNTPNPNPQPTIFTYKVSLCPNYGGEIFVDSNSEYPINGDILEIVTLQGVVFGSIIEKTGSENSTGFVNSISGPSNSDCDGNPV